MSGLIVSETDCYAIPTITIRALPHEETLQVTNNGNENVFKIFHSVGNKLHR